MTTQNIFISYIIGAILPVVALLLTSIVAKMTVKKEEKIINSVEEPIILDKEKEVKPGTMPNKVII